MAVGKQVLRSVPQAFSPADNGLGTFKVAPASVRLPLMLYGLCELLLRKSVEDIAFGQPCPARL
jgi:hypothetical protein